MTWLNVCAILLSHTVIRIIWMSLAVPPALSILVGRAQFRGLVLPSPLNPFTVMSTSVLLCPGGVSSQPLSLYLHAIYCVCRVLDQGTRIYPDPTCQPLLLPPLTLTGVCSTHCIWVLHGAFLWGFHIFEESSKLQTGKKADLFL